MNEVHLGSLVIGVNKDKINIGFYVANIRDKFVVKDILSNKTQLCKKLIALTKEQKLEILGNCKRLDLLLSVLNK